MSVDFTKAWEILVRNFPQFQYGIEITVIYAIVGTVTGLLIGLLVGAIRVIEIDEYDNTGVKVLKKFLKVLTDFYLWVFRGTPMLVQAMFLYYLLKPILGWTGLTAGLVIISVNTGAYMAEIIRSGIQSIDIGQSEAAKSIGLSTPQTFKKIILPQAIKNSFPSIGNQLIINIKDSSMLNVISVTELYFQSTSVAGSTYQYTETFFVTMLIYLFLTTIASLIMNYFEKRMYKGYIWEGH